MRFVLLCFFILLVFCNEAGTVTDYSEHGENWEDVCETGQQQSPIDIDTMVVVKEDRLHLENKLPNLKSKFVYADKSFKFTADSDGEGETTVDDDGDEETYTFLQFHFHSPSEHKINGEEYDAEVHFVHKKDNSDELLVIGVFLDTDSGHWKPSENFFSKFKFDEWQDWSKDGESEELKINIKGFLD